MHISVLYRSYHPFWNNRISWLLTFFLDWKIKSKLNFSTYVYNIIMIVTNLLMVFYKYKRLRQVPRNTTMFVQYYYFIPSEYFLKKDTTDNLTSLNLKNCFVLNLSIFMKFIDIFVSDTYCQWLMWHIKVL